MSDFSQEYYRKAAQDLRQIKLEMMVHHRYTTGQMIQHSHPNYGKNGAYLILEGSEFILVLYGLLPIIKDIVETSIVVSNQKADEILGKVNGILHTIGQTVPDGAAGFLDVIDDLEHAGVVTGNVSLTLVHPDGFSVFCEKKEDHKMYGAIQAACPCTKHLIHRLDSSVKRSLDDIDIVYHPHVDMGRLP